MRWLMIGLLLTVGCASSRSQTPSPFDVVPESWEQTDAAPLNARVDQAVEAGASWPGSPLEITVELFGGDEDTRSVILKEELNRGEGADTVVVVMVRDGFLDDSIRGYWERIVYHRQPDGTWRVIDLRRAYRCWRGHHTDTYSAHRCL